MQSFEEIVLYNLRLYFVVGRCTQWSEIATHGKLLVCFVLFFNLLSSFTALPPCAPLIQNSNLINKE